MIDEFSKKNWALFKEEFRKNYGESPSVLSVLFLVGLSQINTETEELSKEQKQDVIHIGLCHLLESDGIYSFTGLDNDGWPHYKLNDLATNVDIEKQENYIRKKILNYFNYE